MKFMFDPRQEYHYLGIQTQNEFPLRKPYKVRVLFRRRADQHSFFLNLLSDSEIAKVW